MILGEAYELLMRECRILQRIGVASEVHKRDLTPRDHELYAEKPDGCLHPSEWHRREWTPKTEKEQERLHASEQSLRALGIKFDTGGGMGKRDWFIDWSFGVKEPQDGESPEPEGGTAATNTPLAEI